MLPSPQLHGFSTDAIMRRELRGKKMSGDEAFTRERSGSVGSAAQAVPLPAQDPQRDPHIESIATASPDTTLNSSAEAYHPPKVELIGSARMLTLILTHSSGATTIV